MKFLPIFVTYEAGDWMKANGHNNLSMMSSTMKKLRSIPSCMRNNEF